MRNLEVPLVKQHATSATFKSRWLDARQCSSLHLHIDIASTGTPVGTLTIEESNDPAVSRAFDTGINQDSTSDTVSAVDITSSARVEAKGTGLSVSGANKTMVYIHDPGAFIRFVYTRASGGGAAALTCWAQGKTNG